MKNLNEGREALDGKDVECYTGRFAGSFDLDTDIGARISMGDTVAFFVLAHAEAPSFKVDTKTGILKRHNSFTMTEISSLDPDQARYLLDQLMAKMAQAEQETAQAHSQVPVGESLWTS